MGMHSTYTATHYKDLNIDWQARAVTRHGEDILLTPQEFQHLRRKLGLKQEIQTIYRVGYTLS